VSNRRNAKYQKGLEGVAVPDAPAPVYAARYRAARGFADLTQPELAEKLGVDAQTIKRRESGAKGPKKGERMAVAAICGVPFEFMEDGWGALEPSEIRALLDRQTELLERIEGAVDPLGKLVNEVRQGLPVDAPGHVEAATVSERTRKRPASN
jgi:transcriptional regulator with XRE-family HTH domain